MYLYSPNVSAIFPRENNIICGKSTVIVMHMYMCISRGSALMVAYRWCLYNIRNSMLSIL